MHEVLGTEPVAGSIEPSPVPLPRRRRARSTAWIARLGLPQRLAVAWLVLLTAACLAVPLLPLPDPADGAGPIAGGPTWRNLLGTDQLGRDILARLLWGGRTSVMIALATALLAMTAGLALGIPAALHRGRLDTVVTGLADFVLAFPGLVLLIVVSSVFGASGRNLVLSLFVLGTPAFVRITRANALSVSQREFVKAAEGSGATSFWLMTRHILPIVWQPVAAYALTYAAVVFVAEGSLSFLGLGVPPPTPTWGSMIAAGRAWIDRAAHIVVIPAAVLVLTVLALNFLGDRRPPSRSRGPIR